MLYFARDMPEVELDIPKRALFKAAEVCELARVPVYVLRSWEAEFSDLGVAKTPGGARVYRRGDVARVLRIKRLLYDEGLTLAGVRRRLEEEAPPVAADVPIEELAGRNARERLAEVKKGLRSLLELLSADAARGNGDMVRTLPKADVRRGSVRPKHEAARTRTKH